MPPRDHHRPGQRDRPPVAVARPAGLLSGGKLQLVRQRRIGEGERALGGVTQIRRRIPRPRLDPVAARR
ncbi:hypothetical protein [Nonomuraea sp. SBT364]|uniref:hypothetical protein n=1 Tax=Nonomuraea sp. SBT364 TaxID=1580530 RepID=UPI0012E1E3AC|nr:hypothetical protein [Nonomuraea sp. SBT364]